MEDQLVEPCPFLLFEGLAVIFLIICWGQAITALAILGNVRGVLTLTTNAEASAQIGFVIPDMAMRETGQVPPNLSDRFPESVSETAAEKLSARLRKLDASSSAIPAHFNNSLDRTGTRIDWAGPCIVDCIQGRRRSRHDSFAPS